MCVLAHVAARRMNVSLYSGAVLDNADNAIRFMLWNLSGQLLGFHQYRPNAPKKCKQRHRAQWRYYTCLRKIDKKASLSAFGIELLDRRQRVCFLAEGMFDVAPFHQRKVNALGMLCNDPKHLAEWLRSLGYYLVALCDGDEAGRRLATFADEHIVMPEGTDPADMPDAWYDELISQYC